MSKAFERELSAHLESKPRLNTSEKRIQRILDLPKSNPRRKRVLAQIEMAATHQLQGNGGTTAIDWSSIDWEALLAGIMKLIQMIIALFGG